MKLFVVIFSTLVIQSTYGGSPFHDPHFVGDRRVIVQLMEWKFSEIAKECEEFLGPKGFAGVQLTPIVSNAIVNDPPRPWYERYQPVAYKIISRSGNEADFANMVDRCNRVGVRIYVDIILNHMSGGQSGKGTDGSSFDGNKLSYPAVPFTADDFHTPQSCPTSDQEIHDYSDAVQCRNCRLGGLRDLDQAKENVRSKQAALLNKMIDIGVAGFRSDASKHQWPADIQNIFSRLHNLNTKYFPSGVKPFVYHEFLPGGTQMSAKEYLGVGRVIEFQYYSSLATVLRKKDNQKLSYLKNFGEAWGMLPSGDSVIMIDTHDLQRGQTGVLGHNIAYNEPRLLKIATVFMLASPYSVARVMSSYYWPRKMEGTKDLNQYMGPPNNNGEIKGVTRNADGTCNANEWICEHRWREMYNMAKFRNVVGDEPVTNWWDNGNNAIAFGRGKKGFVVINNDNTSVDNTFQTGLDPGNYCDVITGNKNGGRCSGRTISVGNDGKAHITVDKNSDSPMVAIHVQDKL